MHSVPCAPQQNGVQRVMQNVQKASKVVLKQAGMSMKFWHLVHHCICAHFEWNSDEALLGQDLSRGKDWRAIQHETPFALWMHWL